MPKMQKNNQINPIKHGNMDTLKSKHAHVTIAAQNSMNILVMENMLSL